MSWISAALYAVTAVGAGMLTSAGMAKIGVRASQSRRLHVGGSAEVCIGIFALAYPRALSAAVVAGTYCAFLAFLVVKKVRDRAQASCDCFGRRQAITAPHLVSTFVMAAAPIGAALAMSSSPPRLSLLMHGIFLVTGLVVGFLAMFALTEVSAAMSAWRPAADQGRAGWIWYGEGKAYADARYQ